MSAVSERGASDTEAISSPSLLPGSCDLAVILHTHNKRQLASVTWRWKPSCISILAPIHTRKERILCQDATSRTPNLEGVRKPRRVRGAANNLKYKNWVEHEKDTQLVSKLCCGYNDLGYLAIHSIEVRLIERRQPRYRTVQGLNVLDSGSAKWNRRSSQSPPKRQRTLVPRLPSIACADSRDLSTLGR